MTEHDGLTLYACPQCAAPVAGVAADGAVTAEADGHTMCGYRFGAVVDMELWPPAAEEPFMAIPSRPDFLAARRAR